MDILFPLNSKTDLYRQTLIRYLGYCNQVGQSFRYVFPKFLIPSYIISSAYVLFDTIHKTRIAIHKIGYKPKVLIHSIDSLIWQSLASVIIPGFTINRIVKLVYVLTKKHQNNAYIGKAPTIIGLCAIPLIIHPIDKFTDVLMDKSYRYLLRKYYQ